MTETTDLATKKESMLEKQQELRRAVPLVDIYENNEEILLYADMPGVAKDSITVNVDNGKLEISGIRKLEMTGTATGKSSVTSNTGGFSLFLSP